MTTFWFRNDWESAVAARRLFEELPITSAVDDVCFFAQILATSLVANVLEHAGLSPDALIRVQTQEDAVACRVEVSHRGDGFDPLRARRHRPEGAPCLGLRLVNALADRWGYRRDADGMMLWFEIDLVGGRRPWNGREPIPPARTLTEGGSADLRAPGHCRASRLDEPPTARGRPPPERESG